MKIGELAKATKTDIGTIRFYEREDLLPPAGRTQGNYRLYDASHIERLAFIRHCRSLDMALDEVRVLLRFMDSPGQDCGEVNRVLDEHIGHVAARVRQLKQLEKQLKALREQCIEPHAARDCGILNELTAAARHVPADGPSAAEADVSHVPRSHDRHVHRT